MLYIIAAIALALTGLLATKTELMRDSSEFSDTRIHSDAEQFVRLKNIVRGWDAYSRHPDRKRSGSTYGWATYLDGVQTSPEQSTSWIEQGHNLPPQGSPSWAELNSASEFDWKEPTIHYRVEVNWNNTGWTYIWSEGGARLYSDVYDLTEGSYSVCTVNASRHCVIPHHQTELINSSILPSSITPGSIVYAWRNI